MADNFPKDTSHFKLLIADFDGTLAGINHTVTPKVEKAVKKWIDSGRHFSIATGRQYLMIEDECLRMKLNTPVIVRGGAEVVDPATGKVLHSELIEKEDVEKILNILAKNKVSFLVEKDDTLYANFRYEVDFPKVFYKELTEFEMSDAPKVVLKSSDDDVGKVQKLMDEIENSFSKVNITRNHSRYGYGWDITSVKATKLHGIVKVMEHVGVKREDIVGVGDSYNDFPLLEAPGLKVAMGDAHKEVREIADVVIPPYDEDGVAFLIDKLLENSKSSLHLILKR